MQTSSSIFMYISMLPDEPLDEAPPLTPHLLSHPLHHHYHLVHLPHLLVPIRSRTTQQQSIIPMRREVNLSEAEGETQ